MARLSIFRFVVRLAGLALLAPLGAAQAQMKIAVVNVPRLLEEAPQAKARDAGAAGRVRAAPARDRRAAEGPEDQGRKAAARRRGDGRERAAQRREGSARRPARAGAQAERVRRGPEPAPQRRARQAAALAAAGSADLRAHVRTTTWCVGDGVLYVNESIDITAQVLERSAGPLQGHRRRRAEAGRRRPARASRPHRRPSR